MKTLTHKKSGKKYAELTGPKGRVRLSLGTTSAKEAAKLVAGANLKQIEQAMKAGNLSQEAISRLSHGKRVTIAQCITKWESSCHFRGESAATTWRNMANIKQWLAWRPALAKTSPVAIEVGDIYDFINRPDAGGAATRNRSLGSIRSLFRYMVDSGLSSANPAKLVKVNLRAMKHADREAGEWQPFNAAEADTILNGLDMEDDTERFFLLASAISNATAMRIGDVIQLEWDCLTQPGHIIVWTDKRDRRVCLPVNETITPGLAAALGRVPYNDTPYLFPEQKERYDEVSKRSWFPTTFGRILERLDVKAAGKSFHSWRHTALTRWDAQGFSIEQCADYAGHANTKTTAGYIHRKK